MHKLNCPSIDTLRFTHRIAIAFARCCHSPVKSEWQQSSLRNLDILILGQRIVEGNSTMI